MGWWKPNYSGNYEGTFEQHKRVIPNFLGIIRVEPRKLFRPYAKCIVFLFKEESFMEKIVNFCKKHGFIFQGSEIYGGLANTWDYGPLGALLKNNIEKAWRRRFIQERENSFEIDSAIFMHPRVWEASGHVKSFADPLLDCKECKMRHRADNLISSFNKDVNPDKMTEEEMEKYIKKTKFLAQTAEN